MNPQLPSIKAELLTEIIEAAPGRVRKRLDRDPAAAANWQWEQTNGKWTISAGDETVQLRADDRQTVVDSEMVSCSCLLSPRCFHLLAVVTSLTIASEAEQAPESKSQPPATSQTEPDQNDVEITDAMRGAVQQSLQAIDSLLVSGARASGLIIQSALLRAAHQCRAEGLVNLSASLIRIAEGIQRLRAADEHADCDQLRRDTITAIEAAHRLNRIASAPKSQLGYARSPFSPNSLKRLTGVIAEPILTLSGYAGVVTHLIGDDGDIYQLVDTRPGNADLINQAYRGGIDLGETTASAQVISRSRIDVQNLTSSPDGRLGKGGKTRWAIQPAKKGHAEDFSTSHSNWKKDIREQISRVFDETSSPEEPLRRDTNLVCLQGTIVAAKGAGVLFQPANCEATLTLGIAMDHAAVKYRQNLQMLARCPGLLIEVFARLRLDQAGWIDALSFRALSNEVTLPDHWMGRCHLGLDELHRHHFQNTQRYVEDIDHQLKQPSRDEPDVFIRDAPEIRSSGSDLFPGLEKRCAAVVIGGRSSVGSVSSRTHRQAHARLVARGQRTAAEMINQLAMACAEPPAATRRGNVNHASEQHRRPITLAVIDRYCREFRSHYERKKWLHWLESRNNDH